MRFVAPLSESDKEQLTALFKYHDSYSVRRRSHSILLSADGFTIDEIARIYQIHRDTVGTTFDRWEKEGIEGLFDDPRSGRPPKLSDDEADEAVELLKEDPRSIKKALAATSEKTGKEISEWTLKRIAKSAELRWKRMRKSVKGKRDQAEFERVREEITTLDDETGRRVMELLLRLVEDEASTLIYVTHSSALAALADQTWSLHSGVLEKT